MRPLVGDSAERHFEVVGPHTPGARVVLTCEHASAHLPVPWRWPAEDEWVANTHWAFDLGAAALARELADALGTRAVLSRFSRLLADANRPEHATDLFRGSAEGRPIELNRYVDDQERARRMEPWLAYHSAVDRVVAESTAPIVCAVHTFTPVYDGTPRAVEVGVLFDEETTLAEELAAALSGEGFRVAMNEPYSGKQGLMYSVDRHARAHGRRPIEIELRQDLAVDPSARARVVSAMERFGR